MCFGVVSAKSFLVFLKTSFDVGSDTSIKRAIIAFKNINSVHILYVVYLFLRIRYLCLA